MGCNIFEVKMRKNPLFTFYYKFYFYCEYHLNSFNKFNIKTTCIVGGYRRRSG